MNYNTTQDMTEQNKIKQNKIPIKAYEKKI